MLTIKIYFLNFIDPSLKLKKNNSCLKTSKSTLCSVQNNSKQFVISKTINYLTFFVKTLIIVK